MKTCFKLALKKETVEILRGDHAHGGAQTLYPYLCESDRIVNSCGIICTGAQSDCKCPYETAVNKVSCEKCGMQTNAVCNLRTLEVKCAGYSDDPQLSVCLCISA